MHDISDSLYMARAIELAKKAWGDTLPNPMVGAVILKNGKIIGEGWHEKDGAPHAEINAFNSLKESAQGAAIYVTLEPCSTKGRTGACSDAIIANKISRVVIGCLDPNPIHAGRALEIFKANGIECIYGILEGECRDLNFIFNHAIIKREALLALKYAQTSNGKIAEVKGKPSAITGPETRAHVMHYRKLFPAIGIGFKTLISDNPSLTCRIGENETCHTRLIFDRSLNSAGLNFKDFKIFSDKFADKTFIVCDSSSEEGRIAKLKNQNIKIIQINSKRSDPKSFWKELKKALYKMNIYGLIAEGGAEILSSISESNEADYAFEYTSKKIFQKNALSAFEKLPPLIKNPHTIILGDDICRFGQI